MPFRCRPASRTKSLATPVGMAVSVDGTTLYVAAFGSSRHRRLRHDAARERHVHARRRHPHRRFRRRPGRRRARGDRLYALTRFDNAVAVIDLTQGSVGAEIQSPVAAQPRAGERGRGRPFLYDAVLTGSNGEASCASCHIFGDMDDLAWDLGNPDDDVVANGNPFTVGSGAPFHPMKGPMTTQSLRGLVNMGPEHWRGDRQGNSVQAFNAFNVAFPGLVGRDEGQLSRGRHADSSPTSRCRSPTRPTRSASSTTACAPTSRPASTLYFGASPTARHNCNGCHALDPGQRVLRRQRQLLDRGRDAGVQDPAPAQRRIRRSECSAWPTRPAWTATSASAGDQIRGFGFLHDGSIDNVFRFTGSPVFSLTTPSRPTWKRSSWPTPATCRRWSASRSRARAPTARPSTRASMRCSTAAAAAVPVQAARAAARRSATSSSRAPSPGRRAATFSTSPPGASAATAPPSRRSRTPALRALADVPDQELTYTCVPFGSGVRMGIDRDEDTYLDRDEIDAGSDPANAAVDPGRHHRRAVAGQQAADQEQARRDDESKNKVVLLHEGRRRHHAGPGSADDPRCGPDPSGTVKATLSLFSSVSGSRAQHRPALPELEPHRQREQPEGLRVQGQGAGRRHGQEGALEDRRTVQSAAEGKGASNLDYDLQAGVSEGTVAAVFTSGTSAVHELRGLPREGRQ